LEDVDGNSARVQRQGLHEAWDTPHSGGKIN